ncbi:MAG: hypothetical protein ACD_75C00278G0001, partial [uncultured bacterium]
PRTNMHLHTVRGPFFVLATGPMLFTNMKE